MRRLIWSLSVIVCCVACSEKAPDESGIRLAIGNDSTGPMRFDSAGQSWLRLRSLRWMRARGASRADADERFLVREAKTELCCQESEHESATTIDVAVWHDTTATDASLWSHRLVADEADLHEGWYRTITRGCCDSSDLYEFFRLTDGTRVFRASSDWNTGDSILPGISVPNSDLERSVAFHDTFTIDDPPEAAADTTLIGVLQYGSREGPVQRYLVLSADAISRHARLQRLALVVDDTASSLPNRALWSADGRGEPAALSGFHIRLELMTYSDSVPEIVVEIPVARDRLDLARARLHRSIRLKRAP